MTAARLVGAEMWAIGTASELDAITAVLTAAGQIIHCGTRHRMAGADTGRYRVYLRLTIAAPAPGPASRRPAAPTTHEAAVLDLDTARARRRAV
ncbi:hypothetical protein [Salinispora arenicola]|uniref:Uncharacterized protein n=1 Tax=Salinispora arenicola TaxID=168697 RepID=A0A542XID3_SALAC|nr:hypothetical protein [Salinispora arenicola]TQL35611.1 hypothetical protein FB564_0670 [Salinispora arenicola]GIM87956.1 hypothetical protein Sar04_46920 [Salinispora arenicola]